MRGTKNKQKTSATKNNKKLTLRLYPKNISMENFSSITLFFPFRKLSALLRV